MSYNLLLKTQNLKTRVRDSSGNPFGGIGFSVITSNLLIQKIATDTPTERFALAVFVLFCLFYE